jgi:uncharacterized protein YndB with AHSA1/START domain
MRIELTVAIRATPERVYAALTDEIDAWWSIRFQTRSRMRLDAYAGGQLRETWDGGELALATVARAQPGVLLALAGPMGLAGDVDGSIALILVGVQGGTELTLTHIATGDIPEGAEERYRDGWRALLEDGLKVRVERPAR